MSHVTKLNMKVRDLEALSEVLQALPEPMELRTDQKRFAWWGSFVGDSTPPPGRNPADYGHCDAAICYPGVKGKDGPAGPWEIGVCKALDGDGYDLLADTFGGAGSRIVSQLPAIRREYAAKVAENKAMETLARKGFRTVREDLPGSRIRLRLVRR